MQIAPPVPPLESFGERPPNEYRDCPKAHFETTDDIDECPKCGGALHREAQIRSSGGLLMVACTIVFGMFSLTFLGISLLFVILGFREDYEIDFTFLAIVLWSLSLIGVSAGGIYSGKQQNLTGRRQKRLNKKLVWVLSVGFVFISIVQTFSE